MSGFCDRLTRPLTLKYVFALGLLAVLAVTNFWLLRIEIQRSQAMTSILNTSGRQRTLLHRGAWLAERLIFETAPRARSRLRAELTSTIEPLEKSHFALMLPESVRNVPPPQIRAVYEDVPWLLDSEMRNYILHLRSIAKLPDDELLYGNAHFKYVRNPETIDKIQEGLNAVVDVYVQQSEAKTTQLRRLAIWSLSSTLIVLLLNGWLVFRPMVRRVRDDVGRLNELNETLDKRVAERTAESDRRAEQLARSETALRESEALYKSLVNNLPMCVLRKDARGRFTFTNDRYCEFVGRRHDEIVGLTDADLYPAETAAKHREDDRRAMENQQALQNVERHRTPSGQVRYFNFMTAPLRDADGNVVGTQTVFWDITDRKQAERRARHAERLAAIGQMVAGVAHESRNALQQMQACLRLLEWELDGDTSKHELIADLQAAQDRLHRLFDDLREYASPLTLDVRVCHISAIFAQAWASVEAARRNRNASLKDVSIDTSLKCLADPFHLEQVFRNILENSLAACDDPVRIEVESQELQINQSAALQIAIRDNGPGLSPEEGKRIFEPFFTTKTQGTGLGMAIALQIVAAHGGAIQARCRKSGGTEIVITLPCSGESPDVIGRFEEESHA